MASKIRSFFAGCTAVILLGCTACQRNVGPENDQGVSSDTAQNSSLISGRTKYPMFSNEITYKRGEVSTESSMYFNYQAYTTFRHSYTDMIGHDSEVAAVRLADMGIFEKTDTFSPDEKITAAQWLGYLFALSEIDVEGKTGDELVKLAREKNLLEKNITLTPEAVITKEQLAYMVDRAVEDTDNSMQYEMMLEDYSSITESFRESVLQVIALGLMECESNFSPQEEVTRAMMANVLYRIIHTGARVNPYYDLGDLYTGDADEFLVLNSYEENAMGLQLGFYSNYNYQEQAFTAFGKRSIDRVSFYKWAKLETSKGIYDLSSFGNDLSAHKMGSTIISCVDISANLNWNPNFSESNIPSFYEQDITNKETRTAAKQFLYTFVQELLKTVGGDIILSIDYELDWQQRLSGAAQEYRDRAALFADWYVEACQVAREAAKNIGAADRLKLMVIYNNITEQHKLGVSMNEWMIRLAQASDYIGIDSYQFSNDKTLPNITLQNLRFLIDNYSLGKPVIMVENGLSTPENETEIDPATGLPWNEVVAGYYKNLFREFRFACEKGDFLNANLAGALFWSLRDTNTDKRYGVLYNDGSLKLAGEEIAKGFEALEKQKQFNPSILKATQDAQYGATVRVDSGTTYQCLTYAIRDFEPGEETELRIKLKHTGTVFIEVNGSHRFVSENMSEIHVFDVTEGVKQGFNVVKIYFGSNQTPFEQEVQALYFR